MAVKSEANEKPYLFKRIKSYSAEEIIAAGGTTAFGKITHYDPDGLLHLEGEPLSEEDYQQALKQLSK